MDLSGLTEIAVKAALDAGKVIQSYSGRKVEVMHKEGKDSLASQVVTEVDGKAQDAILGRLLPSCRDLGIALLTEESEDDLSRFTQDFFWCIDPMDGTLPFVEGRPGYSVSVALVAQDGSPQIGVVYDPVREVLYQATKGQGMQRNGKPWKLEPKAKVLTCHYDLSFEGHPAFGKVMDELGQYARSCGLEGLAASQNGGAVINACHALENAPGCYFKFPKKEEGGCSIWDYAATACLYQEAEAIVSDVWGKPLDLNRPDSTYMNHGGSIYATDADLAKEIQSMGEAGCDFLSFESRPR